MLNVETFAYDAAKIENPNECKGRRLYRRRLY